MTTHLTFISSEESLKTNIFFSSASPQNTFNLMYSLSTDIKNNSLTLFYIKSFTELLQSDKSAHSFFIFKTQKQLKILSFVKNKLLYYFSIELSLFVV